MSAKEDNLGFALETRQLKVQYDKREILKGIDLAVNRGEAIAIMGTSGGGKTTLLKCLSGLLRPTSGSVFVSGEDISQMPEARLNQVRRKLGLVFQYAALFDYLTVAENVGFGLARQKKLSKAELSEAVKEKLNLVGLEGVEELYPSQLSGGMRKRAGLARALALNPEILLYDEPTSGLDPITAYTIDSLIVSMREKLNVTSVIVSHDVNSVFRTADRVALLSEGKIAAFAPPDELQQSDDPNVQEFLQKAMAREISHL